MKAEGAATSPAPSVGVPVDNSNSFLKVYSCENVRVIHYSYPLNVQHILHDEHSGYFRSYRAQGPNHLPGLCLESFGYYIQVLFR